MKITQKIIRTANPEYDGQLEILMKHEGYAISHMASCGTGVVIVLEKEVQDNSPSDSEAEQTMRQALSNIDMIVSGTGSPSDMYHRIKTVLKGVKEKLNR